MSTELRKIITDQITRHCSTDATDRAWLADDISTRVEAETARLREVERIEYDNRGTIQHHINRAELPRNIQSTDRQPEMVGHIVDELNSAQAKIEWLKANCRIVFYGPVGSYPIEHAPHAKMDCFDLIIEQMPATV